jgi:hypothetical protein
MFINTSGSKKVSADGCQNNWIWIIVTAGNVMQSTFAALMVEESVLSR